MKKYSFRELDVIVEKIAVFADVAIDNLKTHEYSRKDLYKVLKKQFLEYPGIANRLINVYESLECDFWKDKLRIKSMILAYIYENSIKDIYSKSLVKVSDEALSEADARFKISFVLSRVNKELASGKKGFFLTSSKLFVGLMDDYVDSIRATGNYCKEVKVGGTSLLFVIPLREVKLTKVSLDLYSDRKAKYDNPYIKKRTMKEAAGILVKAVRDGELSHNLSTNGDTYRIVKKTLMNLRNNRGKDFISFTKNRDTLSNITVSDNFFDVLKNSHKLALAPYLKGVLVQH